ncbi:hypothetical protein Adt_33266 [Abeliophyllum distichum]|uniref:Uncharacterized protein n=1 Tax=Abeliophyllum distichum TaxID=126358 RepID=A0ABD1QVR6_9LAMI
MTRKDDDEPLPTSTTEEEKDESSLISTTREATAAGAGAVLLKERGKVSPTTSTRISTTFVEGRADGTSPTTTTTRGTMGSRTSVILATLGFLSTTLQPLIMNTKILVKWRPAIANSEHAEDTFLETLYHLQLQTSRLSKMSAAQGDPHKLERCMPPISVSSF